MNTVTLANQSRTTLVLNLPHHIVPELSSRGTVGTRDHDAKSGDRTVRAHRKKISGSITLMPKGIDGDIVRGLPASVLKAPDVQRALNFWPPKIAAKALSKEEREAETKAMAEQAAKDEAAAKVAEELAKKKAAKLSKMAGAETVPTDTKPAERVARSAKVKE